jgi:hypothetical protein
MKENHLRVWSAVSITYLICVEIRPFQCSYTRDIAGVIVYRTPRRTLSQLEKYNFSEQRKPLAGVMQSHQKNDTSPLSRPY